MRPKDERTTQTGRNARRNMVSIVNGRESVGVDGDVRGLGVRAAGENGYFLEVLSGWKGKFTK